MIQLPDFERAFEYENDFYLSCHSTRLSKVLAHFKLFEMTLDLPGALVECGVFKGAALARFAMMRELLMNSDARPIVGFDTFGTFPTTDFESDKPPREAFIEEAGDQSISVEQLREVLENKGVNRAIDLVKGDINDTVPRYVAEHPEWRICLLNLDTDIYEPAQTILEHLYPLIVPGGLLVLDDYGTFPGETKAVDEYFDGREVEIRKFPFSSTPSYIVKGAIRSQ